MRAVVLHEFGSPGNLRYEEAPDPEPGDGQVRIAAAAHAALEGRATHGKAVLIL